MANLGQLRNDVRLVADVDATDVSDAEIASYIQDAYDEILGDAAWPFLMARATFTPSVGQAEYPTSVIGGDVEAHRIQKVMTRGRVLEYVSPHDYYRLNPFGGATSQQAVPQRWTILESENLAILPPPDTADEIQVVYAKLPPPLELDNDEPLLPRRYHQALKLGALVWVMKKIGDTETSDIYKREFTDQASRMAKELLSPQDAEPLIYGGATVRETMLPRAAWPWER